MVSPGESSPPRNRRFASSHFQIGRAEIPGVSLDVVGGDHAVDRSRHEAVAGEEDGVLPLPPASSFAGRGKKPYGSSGLSEVGSVLAQWRV